MGISWGLVITVEAVYVSHEISMGIEAPSCFRWDIDGLDSRGCVWTMAHNIKTLVWFVHVFVIVIQDILTATVVAKWGRVATPLGIFCLYWPPQTKNLLMTIWHLSGGRTSQQIQAPASLVCSNTNSWKARVAILYQNTQNLSWISETCKNQSVQKFQ